MPSPSRSRSDPSARFRLQKTSRKIPRGVGNSFDTIGDFLLTKPILHEDFHFLAAFGNPLNANARAIGLSMRGFVGIEGKGDVLSRLLVRLR